MGFEVSSTEEERIHLVAEQGGKEVRLVHVLRQPTTVQLHTFSRMQSEFEFRRRKASLKKSPAEGNEWLWDQIVVCVEGYTIEGQELTPNMEGWKDKVPLPHKVEAVAAMTAVAAEDEEELGKNSEPPSGGS